MSVAGAILRCTEAMNQLPPLPQRGRGAGGEGCPHHPPGPLTQVMAGIKRY
jgi:hypothetical protein